VDGGRFENESGSQAKSRGISKFSGRGRCPVCRIEASIGGTNLTYDTPMSCLDWSRFRLSSRSSAALLRRALSSFRIRSLMAV
jgi:hypothetical protein